MINQFRRLLLISSSVAILFLLYKLPLPSLTSKYHPHEATTETRNGLVLQKKLFSVHQWEQNAVTGTDEGSSQTPTTLSPTIKIDDHEQEPGPSVGYIAALEYYEQQTMAVGNLLELQCFASSLNLSVVQPFMKNSRLILPLKKEELSNMLLRMDYVFDMEKWKKHTTSQGYSPLVPWEEFIEHAPRDVILVQMKYPTLTYIKQAKKNGIEFPHPVSESKDYERGCGYKVINRAFTELQAYNFKVVGHICYNYITGDLIPLKVYLRDFNSHGRRITILIDEWRGIGTSQRVLVDERMCLQSNSYREHTVYSPALHQDTDAYIRKFITSNTSEGYLAVMARFEMTGLTQRLRSSSDPHAIIPYCLKKTMDEINRMKMTYKLDKVFVSMDIGKYGSKSFKVKKYFGHLKNMASFLKGVYDKKMDITNWEKSFEDVSRSKDAGYIANLQQLLVAKAKCVLFVGGGTFQRHALNMFQQIHRTPRAMCIGTIDKCTSSYRSFLH